MAIDQLAHPALVVVDMQNDFVRIGAPLEVPESRPTIPVHQALLAVCRERDIPVIYTKFVAGPERTLVWEWSPVLAPPRVLLLEGVSAPLRGRGQRARLLGHHRRALS
jgi:isochorismate hydrolase